MIAPFLTMFSRFFHRCWLATTLILCMATPLWAQVADSAGDEVKVWVLQYFVMILFLALALMILLRPTKREDSAFTFDELRAQKEEEMKKLKGTK